MDDLGEKNGTLFDRYSVDREPVRMVLLCERWVLPFLVPVFGTGNDVEYSTVDDRLFTITTTLIPNYGLFQSLSRHGCCVKIVEPDSLVERYMHFLDSAKKPYVHDLLKMELHPTIEGGLIRRAKRRQKQMEANDKKE